MTSALTLEVRAATAKHFAGGAHAVQRGDSQVIVFSAKHPDVGDLIISDDGAEVTVEVGRFTHVHFSNYDSGISETEKAQRIVAQLVVFLTDLFADRVELYGSHSRGGGCRLRSAAPRDLASRELFGAASFVWSGPVANDG